MSVNADRTESQDTSPHDSPRGLMTLVSHFEVSVSPASSLAMLISQVSISKIVDLAEIVLDLTSDTSNLFLLLKAYGPQFLTFSSHVLATFTWQRLSISRVTPTLHLNSGMSVRERTLLTLNSTIPYHCPDFCCSSWRRGTLYSVMVRPRCWSNW